MNETGLFLKFFLMRTYSCDYKYNKSLRGTKVINLKYILAVYVCINFCGNKIPSVDHE